MTSLSFTDKFFNAMHFDDENGLLRRTGNRFALIFKENNIRYFIMGGFALIFHKVIRNTGDIDVLVHEQDFEKAVHILHHLGYNTLIGDSLCVRLVHENFLPIDMLMAPIYGPIPSKQNSIEDANLFFCDLATLLFTKTNAYMGRPMTKDMLWKKKQDHVDLCTLIVLHDLDEDYGKKNKFGCIYENVYRRIHQEYFKELKSSMKTKTKCICQ